MFCEDVECILDLGVGILFKNAEEIAVHTLNKVPKDTLILVCDTQKALLISNSGSPIHPKLGIEKHFEADEKSDAERNNERAGRRYDGGGTGGSFRARSAMEATDPQTEKSEQFAAQIVAQLSSFLSDRRFGQLVVVAPPAFLGVLRNTFDDRLHNMISAEVPKTLTDMPIGEIQKTLVEEW